MSDLLAAANRLALFLMVLVGCGDAVDRRPATWGYISAAILQPSCATVSCHSAAAAAAGLDFSDPDRGYKSLTALSVLVVDPSQPENDHCKKMGATVGCRSEFRPMVVPYNPDQSRVIHMMRARNAPRMPPDRPLPEPDIALVERWILNGAKKVPDKALSPFLVPAVDGAATDGAAADGATTDGAAADGATDAGEGGGDGAGDSSRPDGGDAGADGSTAEAPRAG